VTTVPQGELNVATDAFFFALRLKAMTALVPMTVRLGG